MKKLVICLGMFIVILSGCSSTSTELSDEPVTLTVMGWGFGSEDDTENINRQIVDAYMSENPNVTIEIISPEEGEDYNELLNSLVAAGETPDLFLYAGNTTPVTQGWALDVTSYLEGNETYESIIPVLSEGGVVGDSTYGIPTAMNFSGIYQNNDLIEQQNQTPLEFGYTMDQLLTNIAGTTSETTKGFDMASLLIDWYPAIIDENIEWYNFDGEKFNYSNEAFTETIGIVNDLCAKEYTTECAGDDFVVNGDWAVASGQVAYFQTLTNWDVAEGTGQNFEYIGLPEGNTILIPDYIYASATTSNPEWAVDFALYYGAESYQMMTDYSIANNMYLTPPITNNAEYGQIYKDYVTESGQANLATAYDNAVSGNSIIMEPVKTEIGYNEARYESSTGLVNEETGTEYSIGELMIEIALGKKSLADYSSDLEAISNDAYQSSQAMAGN